METKKSYIERTTTKNVTKSHVMSDTEKTNTCRAQYYTPMQSKTTPNARTQKATGMKQRHA
jgi:hypothetical protein